MAFIYKITRTDGLEYIGITINMKVRLSQHRRSKRFNSGIQYVEILFEGEYPECEQLEESFINKYNTYKNGLNVTKHGKGNHHDSSRFNTLGYKYSDMSKEKMKKAKEGFVPWNKGKKGYFKPSKEWLEKHTWHGSENPRSVLKEDDVRKIINEYKSNPHIDGVGEIQKNGRPMSYLWAFSTKKATENNVTPAAIKSLLLKKSWTHVWKEYES